MRSSTSYFIPLILSSLLPSLIQAQSSPQYGPCVTSCFSTDPISSFCDGDETGAALDQCTCASFSPGNLLIACIQKCPEDQQLVYAQNLPSLCASTLFPNLDLSSTASSTASSSAGSSATSSTGASSTAGSSTSETASATPTGSASPSASETSSETSASGAAASTTSSPNNAPASAGQTRIFAGLAVAALGAAALM